MPDPLPQLYLSFHDITDDWICVLKNDQGERLTVTKEAVGDVAMMLAEFERDADKAEFVAEEWAGRADEIRWEEAELVDEESDELLDQSPGSLVAADPPPTRDELLTLLDHFDRYVSSPDQTGYVGTPFWEQVQTALADLRASGSAPNPQEKTMHPTDIVRRLRDAADLSKTANDSAPAPDALLAEASDEIERLRRNQWRAHG